MNYFIRLLFIFTLFTTANTNAQMVNSGFTYQGELLNNGSPANGTFDILVDIFTLESGGTSFPFPEEFTNVQVTDGLFTIESVDFGNIIYFANSDLWLEIQVKKSNDLAYAKLSPRQKLNTSPFSVRSEQANFASNLDIPGSNNDVLVYNGTGWASGGNKLRVSTIGVSVGTSSVPPSDGLRVGGESKFDGHLNQDLSKDGLPKYMVDVNCGDSGNSISGKDLTGNNGSFSVTSTNTAGFCYITFPQSVLGKYWIANSKDNDGGTTSCVIRADTTQLACQRVTRLGSYQSGDFTIIIF